MAWTLMPRAAGRFSVTKSLPHPTLVGALRSKTASSSLDDKVSVYPRAENATTHDDERAATADHDIWREVE